ncbi:MAG TPA: hypothetical protein VFD52_00510 [Clostridia bacterium]|nr:hypothetical protein [Clostridia bacterium]
MTIIYMISKLITFPGAYIKGFWEHLSCRVLGIPVESSKYLPLNETCGHADHPFAQSKSKGFLVCFLPSFLNGIFAFPFFMTGYINLCLLAVRATDISTASSITFFALYVALLYLGTAMLSNMFPLVEHALNMWDLLYKKDGGANLFWKILLFVPSAIIVAGSFLERYGLTTLMLIALIAYQLFV